MIRSIQAIAIALLLGAEASAFVPLVQREHNAHHCKENVTPFYWNQQSKGAASSLFMIGGFFGGGGGKLALDKAGEITLYSESPNELDVEFDGLSDYVTNKWANLFTTGNIKLTTPVRVLPTGVGSDTTRGVTLLFQNIDTGYQSKKDDKEKDTMEDGNKDKKKKKVAKQGGLEILVEKSGINVQVRAKRCEMDDDTVIKEMSEETILKELKEALDVWKKQK